MLRLIDRYLLREVVLAWLGVTVVLWFIFVANRLAKFLAEAAAGKLPGSVVFQLMGLKSIEYLVQLLPLSLYLAVLLAFGRLYRDNELVVLGACGVGPARLYRPMLSLGVAVGVIVGVLSLYVVPSAVEMRDRAHADAMRTTNVANLFAGRFQELPEGRLVFYAERISADHRYLENLFIEGRIQGRQNLITARRARAMTDERSGDRFLLLEQGYRYEGLPGEDDFRVIEFERYGLRIQEAERIARSSGIESRSTAALLASDAPGDVAQLQWRISIALAAPVLMFLAVPLSRTSPRQGRYGRLVLGILLFIVYYNLLGTARVWVEKGILPPAIGMWWVHAIPVLAGLAQLRAARPGRLRWRLRAW
jgi:lipopolysaccharide export system permease protein